MKPAFSYFGAKGSMASTIWARFGDVRHYVEPFAGSLAVLLARPSVGARQQLETVNDIEGLIANFWRSMAISPDAVFGHAQWPVLEVDLEARHVWLSERRDDIAARLRSDPEWCDPRAAGWWVWGQARVAALVLGRRHGAWRAHFDNQMPMMLGL